MDIMRYPKSLVLLLSIFLAVLVGCSGSSNSSEDPVVGPPVVDPVPPVVDPVSPTPEPEPEDPACDADFKSTFEAIHTHIFVNQGCTASACHGNAAVGGLDLRANVAYENLLADSEGSELARVEPTKVNQSFLFLKLAAATAPGFLAEPVAGSAMPVDGAITTDQLGAIRLWIESGAPETGVVGDEFGGTRIADLLGTCLPAPVPVVLEPLSVPAPDVGIQMALPPHGIKAGAELEICYGEYYDFRSQIPDEFETEDGNWFYANGETVRSLPNTHHLTLSFSGFRADMVNAPEYGTWSCAGGDIHGGECDPLDADFCGEGSCHSQISNAVACIGYGPAGGGDGATPSSRVNASNGRDGFFSLFPSHGIFYWNSHAFNLSSRDLMHRSWHNYYFTNDLRYEEVGFQDTRSIFAANGTGAFTRHEYCADYVLPQGTKLLALFSHTHKRGERFTMEIKGTGELLYDNPFWDDPTVTQYDPARLFDSEDAADRTIHYCALYNNGVKPDGSFDVDLVKRCSRTPVRSGCRATHCAEGLVGEPCNGAGDDASCDTMPGAGDGFCDAGSITGGLTSDDEMMVMIGTRLFEIVD